MATAVKNTKPVIDYAALTADDATMPKSERGGVLDTTPFPAWMAESRKRNVAKSVTVPKSAESQTVYLIRRAAERLDCGARIVAEPVGKSGNVKITFQAKDKRVVKPKPVDAPADAPAEA